MASSHPSPDIGKFDRSVSLLSWAYNEALTIGDYLERAFALLEETVEEFEIVLIDDGSTDGTREIAEARARIDPRLRVIVNGANRGVGFSCRRAIASAEKEYLLWQTVDWSYDLGNLRIFLQLLDHYDVVQGIRPTPVRLLSHIPFVRSLYRVKSRSDNLWKALVSLGNYYLLRICFGVPFHDFQNITIYPTKLIQSVELRGNSSFVNPECLLKVYDKGARFIEVPIPFIRRQAGEAKGTHPRSVLRSVRDILMNWLIWGRRFRRIQRRRSGRHIDRVAEPFNLSDEVLEIVIPLFKCYR